MPPAQWSQITDVLRAGIKSGQLQPGDRLPPEKEIAVQWKVNRATAHRALRELQREGLIVRKRRWGTTVAEPPAQRTGFVALLFCHTREFPQVEYIHGIRDALPDQYHLLFCDTQNDPAREGQYLRRVQKEVDGVLCYPTCAPQNTPLIRRVLESGIPIVCLDRVPRDLEVDAVITDNYGASLEALRALLQRGHRRIAHFTEDDMQISSVRERFDAYLQAMAEVGEPDPARWVRQFPPRLWQSFEQAMQVVHDALFTLLHQPEAPTAVFCLNDYYMAAVFEACDRLKVSVPEDLEIVSYNDCPPLMLRLSQSVHRIVQSPSKMGQMAAERLQRRLRGEAIPVEVMRVPAHFSMARSCAPPIQELSSVKDGEKSR